MVTSSFSFFFAAAFAQVGGGSEGRGTEDGDTGPVSGMGSNKITIMINNTSIYHTSE